MNRPKDNISSQQANWGAPIGLLLFKKTARNKNFFGWCLYCFSLVSFRRNKHHSTGKLSTKIGGQKVVTQVFAKNNTDYL